MNERCSSQEEKEAEVGLAAAGRSRSRREAGRRRPRQRRPLGGDNGQEEETEVRPYSNRGEDEASR